MPRDSQSPLPRRRPRHELWAREEVQALVEMGLLEFGPFLIGGTPRTRAYIEELQRVDFGALATRNEGLCFWEWTGVGELWHDVYWLDCLKQRYKQGDVQAYTLLSRTWRSRLDKFAGELRRSKRRKSELKNQIREFIQQSHPESDMGWAHNIIAFEYVDAQVHDEWDGHHHLHRPLSQSGIFEQVVDLRAQAKDHALLTADERQRFLAYLVVPDGEAKAFVGNVIFYALYAHGWFFDDLQSIRSSPLRDKLPEILDRGRFQMNKDFRLIARAYGRSLGVPAEFFLNLLIVFARASIHDYMARRGVLPIVFWATEITAGLCPEVSEQYRKWVAHFRARVFRSLLRRPPSSRKPALVEAAVGPFRHALKHDPLLNAAFHSDVYAGHEQLVRFRPRGHPTHRVEGLTVAYAVNQLRAFAPQGWDLPVAALIPTEMKVSETVQKTVQESKGSSIFAYVAPLIAALTQVTGFFYTPQMIKQAYRKYHRDPELRSIDVHLTPIG